MAYRPRVRPRQRSFKTCQDVARNRRETKTEPCQPNKSMKAWLTGQLGRIVARGGVADKHGPLSSGLGFGGAFHGGVYADASW
jgi:hypothetical protein